MSGAGNFQGRSTEEGRQAQAIAERVLRAAGFEVIARNKLLDDLGVTVNFIAKDKRANDWCFDTSGSFTSERSGLIRTDTMWKTLGRASVLYESGVKRLIILTTNLPKAGSVGETAMRAASRIF
ncbi:MAG: hypothetical protein ACRD0W_10505, partial [Acidimicrobiales bacterium]